MTDTNDVKIEREGTPRSRSPYRGEDLPSGPSPARQVEEDTEEQLPPAAVRTGNQVPRPRDAYGRYTQIHRDAPAAATGTQHGPGRTAHDRTAPAAQDWSSEDSNRSAQPAPGALPQPGAAPEPHAGQHGVQLQLQEMQQVLQQQMDAVFKSAAQQARSIEQLSNTVTHGFAQ